MENPPAQLSVETRPFFQGLPQISPKLKDLFNKLLAAGGDAFRKHYGIAPT